MRYISLSVAAVLASVAVSSAASAQGLYGEVHGGWDRVSASGEHDDGVAYGVALGYDYAVSETAFIGVELNADDSTTKECVTAGTEKLCIKTGRDLSAVARLGYNVGPNSQLYVLGGYTNARLKLTYTDGTTSLSESENGDGYRVGAGYKYGVTDKAYTKLEYRYSNYEGDFSRHQVLVGLGMNF